MTRGAYAQPAAPPPAMPTAEQILDYLNLSIDWYRHLALEEQSANSASDALFLNNDRQVSRQILLLSFDFAKGAAQFLSKQTASPPQDQAAQSGQYQALFRAAAEADAAIEQRKAELESLKRKLQTASERDRPHLQASVEEVQSELNLDQARSQSLHDILQFANQSGGPAGNLSAKIDEMQASTPDLAADAAKPETAPAQAQVHAAEVPTGILDLVTDLFSLGRRINALDLTIRDTDKLSRLAQSVRAPLSASLVASVRRGDEVSNLADSGDALLLEKLKHELDQLTQGFKETSALVLPLQRQSILFDLAKGNLTRWRDTVQSEYVVERRSLIVRLVVLGFALGIVVLLGEIWRKATLRYVRDTRRRYQFLLLRRIVLWIAVGLTIAFALATEIGSLATFAGLITAGIAVALQNVILAIAGYFFLIGKYGVRVGDRVQISGVTGNVVDVGLIRMHLMELGGSGSDRQPTGRIVVFSNSIVFQPTASFFKQIPGTNFGWREVTFTLAPDSEYALAEKRLLEAVEKVYAKYRARMEQQALQTERDFNLGIDTPQPRSRLRLTQAGLEVVIRYPIELENSSEIDDEVSRELLEALHRPPKLRLVGSGVPNIQPVREEPVKQA